MKGFNDCRCDDGWKAWIDTTPPNRSVLHVEGSVPAKTEATISSLCEQTLKESPGGLDSSDRGSPGYRGTASRSTIFSSNTTSRMRAITRWRFYPVRLPLMYRRQALLSKLARIDRGSV
jgi:hypothetical protein